MNKAHTYTFPQTPKRSAGYKLWLRLLLLPAAFFTFIHLDKFTVFSPLTQKTFSTREAASKLKEHLSPFR